MVYNHISHMVSKHGSASGHIRKYPQSLLLQVPKQLANRVSSFRFYRTLSYQGFSLLFMNFHPHHINKIFFYNGNKSQDQEHVVLTQSPSSV